MKKKIKTVKGAQVFLRVFPDVPVAVKGNEVRMGKGKGSFEYWAARVRMGKVVFEIGGGGIREEIAAQGECCLALFMARPEARALCGGRRIVEQNGWDGAGQSRLVNMEQTDRRRRGDAPRTQLTPAFKLAQAKLPVKSEMISTATAPRLGRIVSHELDHPPASQPIPALLNQMADKGHRKVLVKIRRRNEIRVREVEREFAGLNVRAPALERPEAQA